MKILVSAKPSDGGVETLKNRGYTVYVKTGMKTKELMNNLGMARGDAGINIARLFLGRDRQEGTAINIIKVEAEVPKKVIEETRKVPNALSVQEVFI